MLRVLLVEDNVHDAEAFRRVLERSSRACAVQACERAEQALRLLRDGGCAPDVICVDHGLPGMSGLDLCKELLRGGCPWPLVMLTGVGSESLAVAALKAGVDDYIVKDADGAYLEILPVLLPHVVCRHQDRVARAQAEDALRDAYATLEQRVEERTAELVRANALTEQALEALRGSEARYRGLVDHAPLGVVACDRTGRILTVNTRLLELLGSPSVDQTMAVNLLDAPHLRDVGIAATVEECLATGRDIVRDFCFTSTWGKRLDVRVHLGPLRDGAGQVTGVHALVEDIAQRKRDEALLEERAKLAMLGSAVGLALVQGERAQALQRCAELIARFLDAAVVHIWTLTEPDQVLELEGSAGPSTRPAGGGRRVPVGAPGIGRIAASREPHVTNRVLGDPQVAEQEWAEQEGMVAFAGYPLRVGERLMGVLATFARHELSTEALQALASCADHIALGIDRFGVERALRRREAELRLMAAAVEHAADGIVLTDATGRIQYVNEAFAGMRRSSTAALRGQMAGVLVGKDVGEAAAEEIWRTVRAGRVWSGRVALQRQDGGPLTEDVAISPVMRGDGRLSRLAIVARDVTEHAQREAQFQQTEKLNAVGSLAAGIAHEINTPIQFIGDNVRFLGQSLEELTGLIREYQALRDACGAHDALAAATARVADAERDADVEYLVEDMPQAVAQTLDGVERVAKIVRAMREFSHSTAGERTLADINHGLDTTLTVARNELKYAADVVVELAADLPPVRCNPGELNQVFLNVLVNAAHAIEAKRAGPNAPKGTITVRTWEEDGQVVVSIADTGVGIPEGVRDRVLEPFFTTKEVGKGTGQGLAIAYSVVVTKHGGSLTFDSVEGEGTTFHIRLPIEASEEPHAA